MAYTQRNRRLKIQTPLGEDVLLLIELHGHEGLSTLFNFDVDLISENPNVSFDGIVGKSVSVSIQMTKGDRFINGIVSRFTQTASRVDFAGYSARIVPWLWFLTRTADCRIFQKLSVPDIVKKIFGEYKFTDFSFRLDGSYDPREYCVQYRETDYNFIARLLEEVGIYYFFEHELSKHTLVLADSANGHKPCPLLSKVRYVHSEHELSDDDIVTQFDKEQEVRPGQYTLSDYNFEKPTLDLSANTEGKDPYKYEIYDYPGEYEERSEGDRLAKIRQQEEEVPRILFRGTGHVRAFTSGYRFDLSKHPTPGVDGSYILTSINHSASETGGYTAGDETATISYESSFDCIPSSVSYRPHRVTPQPRVIGVQTAIVVGPKGEEIWVDKYSRVKVQFHWDREGKYDENSSRWVRVSQNWAGKRWGAMFIPRIGQEVIVEFEEGDPDRPIITGRVYNAESMPPYELPGQQTKSAIKSYSSKGGGGFNEIRFEDKKGDEQLFLHAEKDVDFRVKNDRREWVGRDRHLVAKRDRVEEIDRDQHVLIKRDHIEEIDRDHHLTIQGKDAIKITGSRSVDVTGDVAEEFKQNHSEQVTMNYYLKGMQVVIEGMVGLTIKVGGSFVTINPAGVQISGPMVMINSGGSALSGNAGNLVSPTAPATALIADNADPGSEEPTFKKQMAVMPPAEAEAFNAPSHDPDSEENKDKKHWIEIVLVDEEDKPVPGEKYRVTLPDGSTVAEGTLDEKGFARVDNIDPGTCKVTFPNLDKDAWKKK